MKSIKNNIALIGAIAAILGVTPMLSAQQPSVIEFWKDAGITAQAYGGLSIATKSTYASTTDTAYGTTGTYLSPAFGATVWYGNQLTQVGISAGYQAPYNNTVTAFSTTYTEKIAQIPAIVYARYFVIPNLFIGLGGGIAVNMLKVEGSSSDNYTAVTPIIALRTGYDYEIMKNIFIGGAVDISYYFWTINQKIGAFATAADYSANALNIIPMVTIGMKF